MFDHPRSYLERFSPLLADDDARPPLKFIVIEDRQVYGVDLVPELQARFSPDLTITRTHPQLVEGTARGIAYLAAGRPERWAADVHEDIFAPAAAPALRARYARWRAELRTLTGI